MLFSCSVVSDSLQPHGLQQARLPRPSLSPGVCSNSCPLSWWYHKGVGNFPLHNLHNSALGSRGVGHMVPYKTKMLSFKELSCWCSENVSLYGWAGLSVDRGRFGRGLMQITKHSTGERKKYRFKFFLSCDKTWILTQGLELLYFGVGVRSCTKSTSLYLITAGLVFKVPRGEHLCFCLLEGGVSVLYYLLEFAQTQVHWVGDAI